MSTQLDQAVVFSPTPRVWGEHKNRRENKDLSPAKTRVYLHLVCK